VSTLPPPVSTLCAVCVASQLLSPREPAVIFFRRFVGTLWRECCSAHPSGMRKTDAEGGSPSVPHQPFRPSAEMVDEGAAGGPRRSPLRSQLLADFASVHLDGGLAEDEESMAHEASTAAPPAEERGARPREGSLGSPFVADLNTFTADRFFLDPSRQIKAVLFTKKPSVPTLWRQIAAEHAHLALFGAIRLSETELLERFSVDEKSMPKVVLFCPGKRHTFSGPADHASLSAFVAATAQEVERSRASADDDWLTVELGNQVLDPDDALQPQFVFRRQDGVQVLNAPGAAAIAPRLRPFLWTRRDGVLSKLESSRMIDIWRALLLLHTQNERAAFGYLTKSAIQSVSAALRDKMGGDGPRGSELQGDVLRDANGMIQDGRLAYPREDAAYCEALLG